MLCSLAATRVDISQRGDVRKHLTGVTLCYVLCVDTWHIVKLLVEMCGYSQLLALIVCIVPGTSKAAMNMSACYLEFCSYI
jgi:hypothetical protein